MAGSVSSNHREGDKIAEVDALRVALELFIGGVDAGYLAGPLGNLACGEAAALASIASASAT